MVSFCIYHVCQINAQLKLYEVLFWTPGFLSSQYIRHQMHGIPHQDERSCGPCIKTYTTIYRPTQSWGGVQARTELLSYMPSVVRPYFIYRVSWSIYTCGWRSPICWAYNGIKRSRPNISPLPSSQRGSDSGSELPSSPLAFWYIFTYNETSLIRASLIRNPNTPGNLLYIYHFLFAMIQ